MARVSGTQVAVLRAERDYYRTVSDAQTKLIGELEVLVAKTNRTAQVGAMGEEVPETEVLKEPRAVTKTEAPKRRPGRPKGSRNKTTRAKKEAAPKRRTKVINVGSPIEEEREAEG